MTLDTTSESKPSSASQAPVPVAHVPKKDNKLEIDKYFEALVKLDGSDLHLKVVCRLIILGHVVFNNGHNLKCKTRFLIFNKLMHQKCQLL